MDDGNIDRTKSSSEETLSVGHENSMKIVDGRAISIDNRPNPYESRVQAKEGYCTADFEDNPNHDTDMQDHSTLFRPVARVSAFNKYNPPFGASSINPAQGPVLQDSKPEIGVCKFLEDFYGEPVVPLHCGHGCCANSNGGESNHSLLGPEFLEYEEPPPFSSHELLSIATDLNNISWIKSGLENGSTRVPDNARVLIPHWS